MRNIFVVSDTHFGHENIIKFCNRPFSDVWDMNEGLIQRWNAVVTDEDIVYHLGDVYFGKNGRVLERLKGKKRLVLGNHDNLQDKYLVNYFQKIMAWRMLPDLGVLFTHFPIHPESFEFNKVKVNVHGHTHTTVLDDPKYFNASVEHTDYAPIPIDEIRKRCGII